MFYCTFFGAAVFLLLAKKTCQFFVCPKILPYCSWKKKPCQFFCSKNLLVLLLAKRTCQIFVCPKILPVTFLFVDIFICTTVGKRICGFLICLSKILYVTYLFVVIFVCTVVEEKTVCKICCICKLVRVKIG